MNIINFILNNWYLILIGIVFIIFVVYSAIAFAKRPTNEQLSKIKSWLLAAVTEAEKQLGSGTGAVKLSYVYNLFIGKFPAIAAIITYDTFSKLVDEVLVKMREMLSSNKNLQEYVYGETKTEETTVEENA